MKNIRIFSPTKSATQSAIKKRGIWKIEDVDVAEINNNPLMGWRGGKRGNSEPSLSFPTLESAVAYAKSKGYSYEVSIPNDRLPKKKSYADNFR